MDDTHAPAVEGIRDRVPVEARTRASSDVEELFELLLFVDDGLLSSLEVVYYGDAPPPEFPDLERFEPPTPAEPHLRVGTGVGAVPLSDGVSLHLCHTGEGFPVIVLHGGPGLDHSMFRPYLDPLADELRLLFVDLRGQGRSDRVDPETLSLEVFARDVDLLAEALDLDRFALLGHSFGAIVTTWHAINLGTADAYVISGGADSSEKLLADVDASLEAMGEGGRAIAASWDQEQTVETEQELKELLRVQMPFHFAGAPPPGYGEETVGSPDVLRHFAKAGYGDFDYTPDLGRVRKPTLVVVGEHDRTTTPRAAHVLHEGIPDSELVVIPGTGHMSFVEAPSEYVAAARRFLRR